MRCGTRNMFMLNDEILPQGVRPTYLSIVRYKACIFRSMMLRLTIKHISLNSAKDPSECVGKLIMRNSCNVEFLDSILLEIEINYSYLNGRPHKYKPPRIWVYQIPGSRTLLYIICKVANHMYHIWCVQQNKLYSS